MRNRIKVKADLAGVSMNEAIVRLLEQEFPEPLTIDRRVRRLLTSIEFLKGIGDADYIVDDLIKGVRETLEEIAGGKFDEADEGQRQKISESLRQWDREQTQADNADEIVEKLRRRGPVDKF